MAKHGTKRKPKPKGYIPVIGIALALLVGAPLSGCAVFGTEQKIAQHFIKVEGNDQRRARAMGIGAAIAMKAAARSTSQTVVEDHKFLVTGLQYLDTMNANPQWTETYLGMVLDLWYARLKDEFAGSTSLLDRMTNLIPSATADKLGFIVKVLKAGKRGSDAVKLAHDIDATMEYVRNGTLTAEAASTGFRDEILKHIAHLERNLPIAAETLPGSVGG